MSTYNELKEEFEQKVKQLQEKCNHPRSKWYPQYWAIGHTTGYEVLICEICNKELDKRPRI